MMSLHFMKEVPFHTVYVHGLVRDGEGQKMSKSKGNVLDPIDLIDGISLDALLAKRTANLMQPQLAAKIDKATRKQFPDGILGYGTDALRYTFYSLASTGRDIKFDIGRIEGYRNFCNKIWNASRYVLSHAEGHRDLLSETRRRLTSGPLDQEPDGVNPASAVDSAYAQYRFDLASQAHYTTLCGMNSATGTSNSPSLSCGMRIPTRLRHWAHGRHSSPCWSNRFVCCTPLCPILTEEIWQSVSPLAGTQGDSIMLAPWPTHSAEQIDEESESEIEWLKKMIIAIRTIRAEANIPPSTELNVLVSHASEQDKARLTRNTAYLARLGQGQPTDRPITRRRTPHPA